MSAPRRALAPHILRPALFLLLLALATPRSASATISYRISLDHPEQHLLHVAITVSSETPSVTVSMPAWNALYRIRDFAERVRDVTALCPSLTAVPLHVAKLDKQDWKISLQVPCAPGGHNTFIIEYAIAWDTPGPFDSQLDAHHAFLNLAEILMYLPDRRSEAVSVQFVSVPAAWHTVAALDPGREENSYVASSYDALVDAPVEASAFSEFSFEVEHAHIRAVVDAKDWNKGRTEDALRRITAYELHLMGGAPFDSPNHDYLFLIHIGSYDEAGGGGMEHRNSCAIAASSPGEFAELAAHEFFHAWNVKRIRPRALEPPDYSREQYARSLWFAEGVTSAYASYALERTGLWNHDEFLRDLAAQIGTLQSHPARLWQSAEESSLDAWFEGFPEYDDPARSISYYNKGQILGVLLDLAVRDATDNHKSFDDVMRRMNDAAAHGELYDDVSGIRTAVEAVAGKSFADFFTRYVSGTDEIPYDDFLALAGLTLNSRVSDSAPPRFTIVQIPNPTPRQKRILNGVLRGVTD